MIFFLISCASNEVDNRTKNQNQNQNQQDLAMQQAIFARMFSNPKEAEQAQNDAKQNSNRNKTSKTDLAFKFSELGINTLLQLHETNSRYGVYKGNNSSAKQAVESDYSKYSTQIRSTSYRNDSYAKSTQGFTEFIGWADDYGLEINASNIKYYWDSTNSYSNNDLYGSGDDYDYEDDDPGFNSGWLFGD